MENTNTRLYYFKTKAAFDAKVRSNSIPDSAIVFIEQTKQVYTHGQLWDGSDVSSAIAKIEQKIKEAGNGLKNGDTLGYINNNEFKVGDRLTIPGKEYTAGEGIDITGTTVKAKPATSENIGGVKLGYPSNGNNYELKVDGYNRAYVNVPGNSNSNSTPGQNGGFWELIFTYSNTTPVLPSSGSSNIVPWDHSVPNVSDSIIWMADRWVSGDGTYGPWQGPWRISGTDGKPGVDGDEFEYVYTRTAVEDKSICHGLSNSQIDDYVPTGWTDDPQGVSSDLKYEWMAFRKKEHSSTNLAGTWTPFTGPILWSAYGREGIDGDSVEYIYFAGLNNRWVDNPAYWGNDAGFQDDEYVRPGSGWRDNPIDLESAAYGPGSKQWVAVRKKRNKVWQAFSEPKLWGYYPNDGRTGNGIVADTDNDMIAVSLDENNENYALSYGIAMHMYEDASNILVTGSEIQSVKWEDGTTVSYSNEFVANNGLLTINIPAGTYTFDSASHGTSMFITVEITGTTTYGVTKRNIVVQLAGFRFGADGTSYKLGTSAKVIRKSKAGVLSPDQLEAWCIKTEGTGNIERWTPSTIAAASNGEFQLKYAINDNSDATLNQDSITIPSNADTVTISLYYVPGSSYLVDQETIPVIREGDDGLSSIMYQIHVLSNSMRSRYADPQQNVRTVSGNICFAISKTEGANPPYYLDGTEPEISIDVLLGGLSGNVTSLNCEWGGMQNYYDPEWHHMLPYVTASSTTLLWRDNYAYTTIVVKESGIPVVYATVPTIIEGKDGDMVQQQPLSYAVTRIRRWKSSLDSDEPKWNDGTQPENGVHYIDVVIHNKNYYVCKSYNTSEVPGSDTSETADWKILNSGVDSAYNLIVANYLASKSITAKQVVITDNNDAVVAGMLSGNNIPSELTGTGWSSNNSSGIRIFAGQLPDSGNVADAAFTVDSSGNVKMGGNNIISGDTDIKGSLLVENNAQFAGGINTLNLQTGGQITAGNIVAGNAEIQTITAGGLVNITHHDTEGRITVNNEDMTNPLIITPDGIQIGQNTGVNDRIELNIPIYEEGHISGMERRVLTFVGGILVGSTVEQEYYD